MDLYRRVALRTRRLTGRVSERHLSTEQLDEKIQDALLDLQRELNLLDTETTYRFYTSPCVSRYDLNQKYTIPDSDSVYETTIRDYYHTISSPASVDGCCIFYTEFVEEYNHICRTHEYKTKCIQPKSTSDSIEIELEHCIDPLHIGVCLTLGDNSHRILQDQLLNNGKGQLFLQNQRDQVIDSEIDYQNGKITFRPSFIIDLNQEVCVKYRKSSMGKPTSIFRHGTSLLLNPVPNKCYAIELKAQRSLIFMLKSKEFDFILERWWEYIAVVAAIKIQEDQADDSQISTLLPIFDRQYRLINREKLNHYRMKKHSRRELFPIRFGGSRWL